MNQNREQMNVVIVGHVDHGKSTLVGRLLADTGSLPDGKLEAVKAMCARNAKPFEYAFLLDALKDEQSQGITIDTARSFFKSSKRDYIIIDAPGHIEFLKNMISGAARAEAALLVIDANEGIKENSKRHGYMMSFLGIKNVTICVNKMDLVDYRQDVFEKIKEDYSKFLAEINLRPRQFIPIAAREGDNIVSTSSKTPWYKGHSILEVLDSFAKESSKDQKELRFPLQDIYKFTEEGDERRIFSGRIESGTIKIGDEITFLPSKKTSRVRSIEAFNLPEQIEAYAGQSTGITLDTQIYVRPGEIICKSKEKLPHVSTKLKVNIFWMGKQPFITGKTYKLKLATQQIPVILSSIVNVLDASELSSISNKSQVDRHDVAECILETLKPVAFDEITTLSETGRFVIVDNYEIAGGGIVLTPVFEEGSSLTNYIKLREFGWERSGITPDKRFKKYEHKSALIVFTGKAGTGKIQLAKSLEEELFNTGRFTYFLGISNQLLNPENSQSVNVLAKHQYIQQLGETAHVLTDAGLILITSISNVDEHEINILRTLNRPNPTIVINVGEIFLPNDLVSLNLSETETTQNATSKIIAYLNNAILLDPEYTI